MIFGIGQVNPRLGIIVVSVVALRGAPYKLRMLFLDGEWGLLLGAEGRDLMGLFGAHKGCHDGRQLQVGALDPSLLH